MSGSALFDIARKLDLSNLPRRAERITYTVATFVEFVREFGGLCIDAQLTNNAAAALAVSETQFDTNTETIAAGAVGVESNVLHRTLFLTGAAVNVECKFGILEQDVILINAKKQGVIG